MYIGSCFVEATTIQNLVAWVDTGIICLYKAWVTETFLSSPEMTTLYISNQNIWQLPWNLERNFIMKQPHDMDPIIS
jgi:hypothetical protein